MRESSRAIIRPFSIAPVARPGVSFALWTSVQSGVRNVNPRFARNSASPREDRSRVQRIRAPTNGESISRGCNIDRLPRISGESFHDLVYRTRTKDRRKMLRHNHQRLALDSRARAHARVMNIHRTIRVISSSVSSRIVGSAVLPPARPKTNTQGRQLRAITDFIVPRSAHDRRIARPRAPRSPRGGNARDITRRPSIVGRSLSFLLPPLSGLPLAHPRGLLNDSSTVPPKGRASCRFIFTSAGVL